MVLKTLPIEVWRHILLAIPYDWAPRLHNHPDPLTVFSAHESTLPTTCEIDQTIQSRARLLTVCKAWYPIAEEILYSDLCIDSWDDITLFQKSLPAERGDRQPLGWFTRSIFVKLSRLEVCRSKKYRKEHWEDIKYVNGVDHGPRFEKLKSIVKATPRLQAVHIDSTSQNDSEWGLEYRDWFNCMLNTVETFSWLGYYSVPFGVFGPLSPLCKRLVNIHLDLHAYCYSNNPIDQFRHQDIEFPALRRLVIRDTTIDGINLKKWTTPNIELFSVPRLSNYLNEGVKIFLARYGKQLRCLDTSDLLRPQWRQRNRQPNTDPNLDLDPDNPYYETPGLFEFCPNLKTLILDLSALSRMARGSWMGPTSCLGLIQA